MVIKTKMDVVKTLLNYRHKDTNNALGKGSASANMALCKYWGKRNKELQLPMTSSLSVALGHMGTQTTVSLIPHQDRIILNGDELSPNTEFAKRVSLFLDLFRFYPQMRFLVNTQNTIPTSTGLGSSSSGFAALTLALNDLFMWNLDKISLSILARLGSGSACRSLWPGFVKWLAGTANDGMDSFSKVLPFIWPELRLGLLVLSKAPKTVSSRDAMSRTVSTSPLYPAWPQKVAKDLDTIERAIAKQNFSLFGEVVESNSLTMHACLNASWPPISYATAENVVTIQQIWKKRQEGLPLYFTQDAGPNLCLLFLVPHENNVRQLFRDVIVVNPFEYLNPKGSL